MRSTRAAALALALIAALLAACSAGTSAGTSGAGLHTAPTTAVVPAAALTAAGATPPQHTPTTSTPTTTNRAAPKPVNHCARNTSAQHIIVSIRHQHMWLCARHRTVYDNPVTTGMAGRWTSTPTGNYQIQGRSRNAVLTLNTGAAYHVKYWIPFDAPDFGFHDSAWQRFPYGSPEYRTDGSHGCVHMPLKAIAFLYTWVARPTSVHIS